MDILRAMAQWGQAALDLLLPQPPICALCTGPSPVPVCAVCLAAMVTPPGITVCDVCCRPVALREPAAHAVCLECLYGRLGVVRVAAIGLLRGPLQHAVHALKFRDRPDLAAPLGEALGHKLVGPYDALVPTPLHRARQTERGYNQTALLARAAAGVCGTRTQLLLRRVRVTVPQTRLGRQQRLANLAGAFATVRRLDGMRVCLVDDVLTTGATAAAAAAALWAAGAAGVDLAVLAVSTTAVPGIPSTDRRV